MNEIENNFLKQRMTLFRRNTANPEELANAIRHTKDDKLIKYAIEHAKEYYMSSQASKLIPALSKEEDIVYYITNLEKYGLPEYLAEATIANAKDLSQETLKQIMKQGVGKVSALRILTRIDDPKYIFECFKEHEKYKISSMEISLILNSLNNKELTYKCLRQSKQIGWEGDQVTAKLAEMDYEKNKEIIRECLINRQEHDLSEFNILTLMDNEDLVKYCVPYMDKMNMGHISQTAILLRTNDEQIIQNYIEKKDLEKQKRDAKIKMIFKYGLGWKEHQERISDEDKKIIERFPDIEDSFYKAFSSDSHGTNNSKEESHEEEVDYEAQVQKYADEVKRRLTDSDKLLLYYHIGDEEKVDEILKKNPLKTKLKDGIKINVPKEITIGVEIETEGIYSLALAFVKGRNGWNFETDSSLVSTDLDFGSEVVSPILSGDKADESTEEIIKICKILQAVGQHSTPCTGGHVHIGADYLDRTQDWKNLLEIWGSAEKEIYTISNGAGEIPRDGVEVFATPIAKDVENGLENGEISLNSEEDLKNFQKQLQMLENTRYKSINFQSLEKHNTVEFRLANGTVNPETWIYNINLFGNIVKTAHDLSLIQEKDSSERTLEEEEKILSFERLKESETSEEKVNNLLNLVIDDDSVMVYLERYMQNSRLIKSNVELSKALDTGTSLESGKGLNIDRLRKKEEPSEEKGTSKEELIEKCIFDGEVRNAQKEEISRLTQRVAKKDQNEIYNG